MTATRSDGAAGTGLVLFAHGARDPGWAGTVHAIADRLAQHSPSLLVECAFLDFIAPDLREAVARLSGRGAQRIVVAPVFLSAGGHVLRDLPQRLSELQPAYPALRFEVLPALGAVPGVIDAMARACADALDPAKRS